MEGSSSNRTKTNSLQATSSSSLRETEDQKTQIRNEILLNFKSFVDHPKLDLIGETSAANVKGSFKEINDDHSISLNHLEKIKVYFQKKKLELEKKLILRGIVSPIITEIYDLDEEVLTETIAWTMPRKIFGGEMIRPVDRVASSTSTLLQHRPTEAPPVARNLPALPFFDPKIPPPLLPTIPQHGTAQQLLPQQAAFQVPMTATGFVDQTSKPQSFHSAQPFCYRESTKPSHPTYRSWKNSKGANERPNHNKREFSGPSNSQGQNSSSKVADNPSVVPAKNVKRIRANEASTSNCAKIPAEQNVKRSTESNLPKKPSGFEKNCSLEVTQPTASDIETRADVANISVPKSTREMTQSVQESPELNQSATALPLQESVIHPDNIKQESSQRLTDTEMDPTEVPCSSEIKKEYSDAETVSNPAADTASIDSDVTDKMEDFTELEEANQDLNHVESSQDQILAKTETDTTREREEDLADVAKSLIRCRNLNDLLGTNYPTLLQNEQVIKVEENNEVRSSQESRPASCLDNDANWFLPPADDDTPFDDDVEESDSEEELGEEDEEQIVAYIPKNEPPLNEP